MKGFLIMLHVNSVNHVISVNSVNIVNSVNSVNSVISVNSVNSYSAVLPPSPMVFFSLQFVALGSSVEEELFFRKEWDIQ